MFNQAKQSAKIQDNVEKLSVHITNWIGTPASVVVHTIIFTLCLFLFLIGLSIDTMLLVLTTAVSLEAIYLAIFIQMTVNRTTRKLESVEDEIEDIQENVQGLETDVEEISEDIDKIQVEETSEDENTEESLDKIEEQMKSIIDSLENLKKHVQQHPSSR